MIRKPTLIFGAHSLASCAAFNIVAEGGTVIAHVVDDAYVDKGTYEGRPLIPFSQLQQRFPADECDALVVLGYTRMNDLRRERCKQLKALGYRLQNYVSRHATVWRDCRIGDNVLIFENCTVQPYVTLGVNVILRGSNIGHHSSIGDHSFIATGVVTGGEVTISPHCFIGLGAVLRDGITIAERSFIGAGAVVVSDTEPDGVYVGNPAKRIAKSAMEITDGIIQT
ncbi:acetyltransferase [bacterium]|nr:acetyltransferase [bacterium]